MNLEINDEISKNISTNNEIKDFMKQLQNILTKDNSRINNLYNEILQEIPLASRYEHQLSDIIKEGLNTLSYEYDFLYFDYDKNEKSYFIDGYSEGNIIRNKMSDKDLEGTNFEKGTFWEIYDEDHVVEADELKDYLKINIESKLETLEFENEKKAGKR